MAVENFSAICPATGNHCDFRDQAILAAEDYISLASEMHAKRASTLGRIKEFVANHFFDSEVTAEKTIEDEADYCAEEISSALNDHCRILETGDCRLKNIIGTS